MTRIFLSALLAALLLPYSVGAQDTDVIDEIVAVVDDKILLRSDVNGFVYNMIQQNQIPYSDDLWEQALTNLIDQKIVAVHARRDTTLEITDEQVDQLLDERVNSMISQIGGRAALEATYNKTVEQIKLDLREDFRDQLLAEQFRNRAIQDITVTPSEVREWFEQIPQDSLPVIPESVRLSHIVKYPIVTEAAKEDARYILTSIRDSILAGASTFEQMAILYSEDPGSAPNGGLYANANVEIFVPEFALAATRTPIGEVSEIFETQFGLHILRVNARRGTVADLNQILITFDESKFDTEPARRQLQSLRDSVAVHSAAFDRLAREYSDETESASLGGRVVDPRNFERDLYVEGLDPSWRTTVQLLSPGDISEVQTANMLTGRRGLHIILLEAKTPEHQVSYETDYSLIEGFALREKRALELDKWIRGLREDVYVKIKTDKYSGEFANR